MIIMTLFQEGKTLRHYFQATKSYKSVFFNNVALSLSLSLGCRVDHEYGKKIHVMRQ